MRYDFRVWHREEGKSEVERFLVPFTEEKERHEYQCFPSALALKFSHPGIQASSAPASNAKGVVMTLLTDLPEHQVFALLETFLIQQNNAIPGLCLVCEKL